MEAGAEYEWVGLEVRLVGIHWKEEGLTFARIERKTPVLRPQSFNRNRVS